MISEEKTYVCLSFEEINVIIENYQSRNLPDLIARLDNLLRNTTDPALQKVLNSVLSKVMQLTPDEYTILLSDIDQQTVLFPPYYTLPKLVD